MASDQILKDLQKCISLKIPSRVPCFPTHVMYDYYTFGTTHRKFRNDPEVMVSTALWAVKRYDYDWYLHHPDDLAEYEFFDVSITDEEHVPPAVWRYGTPELSLLDRWSVSRVIARKGRFYRYLEGLTSLRKELGDRVCITGRTAAPFSSLSLLIGIEQTMLLMLEDPALFDHMTSELAQFCEETALAVLEAGAHAVWVGDCTASSHFISPEHYLRHAQVPASQVLEGIRKNGGTAFYHAGDKSAKQLAAMADLPCDILSVGYGIDMGSVKEQLGSRKCLMGNLDTVHDLHERSAEEIEDITGSMVASAKTGGGYIFGTGEAVLHNTPEKHIQAMISAVRTNGTY